MDNKIYKKEYIIEESEKYAGCFNIYDKNTGERVEYFAEKSGNEQLAKDWIKKQYPIKTPSKKEKTPSQRLRNTLYRYWEQYKPTPKFEKFYNKKMEEIINLVKSKLS